MGEPQGVQIFPVRSERKGNRKRVGLVEGQTRDQTWLLQLPPMLWGKTWAASNLHSPSVLTEDDSCGGGPPMTEDYVEHGVGACGLGHPGERQAATEQPGTTSGTVPNTWQPTRCPESPETATVLRGRTEGRSFPSKLHSEETSLHKSSEPFVLVRN